MKKIPTYPLYRLQNGPTSQISPSFFITTSSDFIIIIHLLSDYGCKLKQGILIVLVLSPNNGIQAVGFYSVWLFSVTIYPTYQWCNLGYFQVSGYSTKQYSWTFYLGAYNHMILYLLLSIPVTLLGHRVCVSSVRIYTDSLFSKVIATIYSPAGRIWKFLLLNSLTKSAYCYYGFI